MTNCIYNKHKNNIIEQLLNKIQKNNIAQLIINNIIIVIYILV